MRWYAHFLANRLRYDSRIEYMCSVIETWDGGWLHSVKKREECAASDDLQPTGKQIQILNTLSLVVIICTTRFNIQQFYVLPTECICVSFMDLRTNSDYFPTQHSLTGFYNRHVECLLRGTSCCYITHFTKHKTQPIFSVLVLFCILQTVFFQSPYLLHFPTLYLDSDIPLPEGRAGDAWKPSQQ